MTDKNLRLKSFTDLHHFDWLTCDSCRHLVFWSMKDSTPLPEVCPNCQTILKPLKATT